MTNFSLASVFGAALKGAEPEQETVLPKPLSREEIEKLPKDLLQLVASVEAQLNKQIEQLNDASSQEQILKTVTTAILGREGTWQELGEYVASKGREGIDAQYGVPNDASEEQRIKIISEAIGKEWQKQIGSGEDYLKRFEDVDIKLKAGLNLPSEATDEDLLKAGEKRASEIVGGTLGLPKGASIEEMKAALKAQQEELLKQYKAEKK